MAERNAPLGKYRKPSIPSYPVNDSWVNRENWLDDINYCLKRGYVWCHQCTEWVRKKYCKHRGRKGAGCHWRKKCPWCTTYGYNKRIDKGSCHIWVNGQCKRLGDVVGDPHILPVPSSIMSGVISLLSIPKLQLGITSAEHEYQE
jgi:hypothetical protein